MPRANGTRKQRSFGVEIECIVPGHDQRQVAEALRAAGIAAESESYNHETRSHWKLTTDSSVCGGTWGRDFPMEIVSPVLRYSEGRRQLEIVCGVLKTLNAKVNKTCGLHVHHGVSVCKKEHVRRVIQFYALNEHWIDRLVAKSRRADNGQYCKSLATYAAQGSWHPLHKIVHTTEPIRKWSDLRWEPRYTKINMQSFVKYGTMEVRHHQGSVEAPKILDWVEFVQAMFVCFHEKKPVPVLSSTEELMNFLAPWLDEAVRTRMLNRIAKLDAVRER